ncbi:MAG TPA: GNAT family N-acetyltransferase [Polyangiaceae bacterium]|jgi:GNAT superfamily N-acetyltransferase
MSDLDLRLVSLSPEDGARCATLGRFGGWETEPRRWATMLGVGQGWGALVRDALVGVVIVNRFGPSPEDERPGGERQDVLPSLASVAMMMVDPGYRRRGVAQALLERALESVQGAPVFLLASAMGRPLYAGLGFEERGQSERWTGTPALPPEEHPGLRPLRGADRAAVVALDAAAQGAPRTALLDAVLAGADRAFVVERQGELVAFGLSAPVEGFRQVGPMVAEDDRDAVALASRLSFGCTLPLKLDLPVGETVLAEWARAAGLSIATTSTFMVRGANPLPGRRAWVRAYAGRAYG